MWTCHKCGKPVYFAERRQSLGFSWHPECLRCEECGRRLEPGAHAEHKAAPYCHVPCYGALFGPQLFGHGSRVETHSSFGSRQEERTAAPRSTLEAKLKLFNQFHDGNSAEIRSREVNGRLVLEGALRIHWGVLGLIHLKEDDDQRTVVTVRKRNSRRFRDSGSDQGSDSTSAVDSGLGDQVDASSVESNVPSPGEKSQEAPQSPRSLTLPCKLDTKRADWDELDELLRVERVVDETDKPYQTLPSGAGFHREASLSTQSSGDSELSLSIGTDEADSVDVAGLAATAPAASRSSEAVPSVKANGTVSADTSKRQNGEAEKNSVEDVAHDDSDSEVEYADDTEPGPRGATKTGAAAIKRRPGKRRSRAALRRRCSINGHFYDRETSFFTPPLGSSMSLWVSSLVNTAEVINLLLDKYKVDSRPSNFALFVVHDNGEQRRLLDNECPLVVRVMLGPHEDVSRVVLTDAGRADVSADVAQFLNLSAHECRSILDRYRIEEEREAKRVRAKFREMRRRIKQRMEDLKVRL